MNLRRVIPDSTTREQHKASDPRASVWVSAHAGSGKTHVLTQRVVRLLLEGAPPAKILCLTYTKAAAANMSLRVFDILSKWTMLDDAQLTQAILAVGAGASFGDLDFARRLFARAVETPGGLKIQTIHAFCERLLHLFPFEANLPSRFQLIEDMQKGELLELARQAMLAEAMGNPDSALGRALAVLSAESTEDGFEKLVRDALGMRRQLAQAVRAAGSAGGYRRFLRGRLGLANKDTIAEIERAMVEDGIPFSDWPDLAESLAQGSVNDQKLAEHCRRAAAADGQLRIDAWLDVFLTQQGRPRGGESRAVITKTLQKLDPCLLLHLQSEQDRLVLLAEKRKAARVVEQTTALVTVADRVLQHYASAKNTRALLDFDDLIDKTLNLLSRSDAGWILFKLDSGIDHILIDEAQDTSPEQWDILRRIAEEFTSGKGQRSALRTFFAVGDEKQSIFSFQGARPAEFADMRAHFRKTTENADGLFQELKLHLSFRSAPRVLESVDTIFKLPANRAGLSSDDAMLLHQAWKTDVPGLVEIWEPVAPLDLPPSRDWKLPLDAVNPHDPHIVVAARVAALVAGWLRPDSRDCVTDDKTGAPRAIRAGDVIVLVRTRSAFFEAVIRAFKDAGVPVAGADRLKFARHIAVMDLIAAGRAALLPQDDLALACVLKSPLIGLIDDDLIELAPLRAGSLMDALRGSASARHQTACARIDLWRARARQSTPFMFYAHLLGADGGRRDLVARLGAEASDAIDEFLNQSLKHEQNGAPSLPAFLHALESVDGDVKRDMDAATDAVRVMTVHAAKGLEAKIVVLPDTCSMPDGKKAPVIYALDDGSGWPALVWSRRKDDDPAQIAQARTAAIRAMQEEYRRLLYVALTRAEERLYVMGYQGAGKRPEECWYNMIRSALEPALASAPAFDGLEQVLRRAEDGVCRLATAPVGPPVLVPPMQLPEWLTSPARAERGAAPPVRPSSALAAADEPAARMDVAAARTGVEAARLGRLIHALLQHLPNLVSGARGAAARRFLLLRAPALDEGGRNALVDQALAVLAHRDLAALFGPGSRAEVSLAGRVEVASGRTIDIIGQIDRLVVTQSEVLIADFKTGAPRPADRTPISYAAQLALYAAALAAIYPERKIRALLVWVNGPQIVELAAAQLRRALAFAGRDDVSNDQMGVIGDGGDLDGAGAAT